MTKYRYGWKFLNPYGASIYGDRETIYNLPRADQKWSDPLVHPELIADGRDCGPGRWHVMKDISAAYAPDDWWVWFARCEGVAGESNKLFSAHVIQLRRVTRKVFWRMIRFGWCAHADLHGAGLCDADLHGAVLHGADLCNADMIDADLRGADLRDADMIDADLRGADLTDANLIRANLIRANLYNAYLIRADLCNADLAYAGLTRAKLTRANLRNAVLRGADLSRADLSFADLTNADLHGANLTRANLSGAIGI